MQVHRFPEVSDESSGFDVDRGAMFVSRLVSLDLVRLLFDSVLNHHFGTPMLVIVAVLQRTTTRLGG